MNMYIEMLHMMLMQYKKRQLPYERFFSIISTPNQNSLSQNKYEVNFLKSSS